MKSLNDTFKFENSLEMEQDISSSSKDLENDYLKILLDNSTANKFSFEREKEKILIDDFFNIVFDGSVMPGELSIENKLNKERNNFLKDKITSQLLETILEESFEFGIKSKSETLIEEQLQKNELATRNWLNEIFVDYFDDEKILIGILRIIGRFDERIIFPQGQTMALAALNHKNPEIKELGIRAFENWGSLNSLKILENIKIGINWLENYKDQVISDLKEELLCI